VTSDCHICRGGYRIRQRGPDMASAELAISGRFLLVVYHVGEIDGQLQGER
jgi:hypothetical protein